jgi:hypothetical protein
MAGNEEVAIMLWTCHTVELSQMLRRFVSRVGGRVASRVSVRARTFVQGGTVR